MIFEYDLTIPANTSVAVPAKGEMKVARGIIHKVEVTFPAGCNRAVLVTIRRALHQVWPTNPDGQLKANNYTISFPVWYEIDQPPYEMQVYGWSPGTTYPHVITVRLGISSREVLDPGSSERGILGRLGEAILGKRK